MSIFPVLQQSLPYGSPFPTPYNPVYIAKNYSIQKAYTMADSRLHGSVP
jgi:hypothetical protein